MYQSVSYEGKDQGSQMLLILNPKWGFFVTKQLEVEPGMLFQLLSVETPGERRHTTTSGGGTFNLSYNFEGLDNSIPFISGGLGFLMNTDAVDDETTMIFPYIGAGVKSFLTEKAALRSEIFYQHWTNTGGIENFTTDNIGVSASLSVFLR